MSFIKKLLPFLFKEKDEKSAKPAPKSQQSSSRGPQSKQGAKSAGAKPNGPKSGQPKQQSSPRNTQSAPRSRENSGDQEEREPREPSPIVGYAIIAKNKNHRGLRKGSKVYIRQILDDDDRLRVRATSPSGKKVTLTLSRQALTDFESEGVPEHLARHYSPDSIFEDEHEAKVKAEVLGKR